jgi:predicted metallopeptidase
MKVIGKNGAELVLDDKLRTQAVSLINENPDVLGHIDHQRVVFVRTSDNKGKWFGKTWFLNAPHTILPWYAFEHLSKNRLTVPDLEINAKMADFLNTLLTVSYVIALNNTAFEQFEDEDLREKQERNVLLHELFHIAPDMDGINKHDLEDFADLVRKFGPDWSQGIYSDDEGQHS